MELNLRTRLFFSVVFSLMLLCLATGIVEAQTVNLLHSFANGSSDGAFPGAVS